MSRSYRLLLLAQPQNRFCLFGLGFWFRAEIMLAESFKPKSLLWFCLERRQQSFGDVTKSTKDAIDSKYFVFLNTVHTSQWLYTALRLMFHTKLLIDHTATWKSQLHTHTKAFAQPHIQRHLIPPTLHSKMCLQVLASTTLCEKIKKVD